MTKLVGIDAFRAEQRRRIGPNGKLSPQAGTAGGVFRVSAIEPKAYEDDSRKFRFCFSDGSVDRMGDTIDAQGWRINDFMANPVALWAHDSSAPPIGRASNVLVENERLMGDITFADAETYAFADTIYRLVKGKFINAVSVGFIPVEYDWSDDDEREWGIDFKVQSLIEISICPVPANPNALGEARAKGIDLSPLVEWAERSLDGAGKIAVPRSELERLRKSAKGPASPRRRDTDSGMSETDPSSGGAVVATCARSADDECGMSNPQECAVHMATETEDKRIARLVARGVRAEIKRLGLTKGVPKIRRRDPEDGDGDGDESDHSDAIAKAMDHLDNAEACFKEADDHYDDGDDKHEEGMSHHAKAMEALDSVRESMEDDAGPDSDPDSDKAAARRLRRAKRLAAQHSNT